MVQALTDEGMAVVWSTAYLDEAERCESVLLLNQGQLLFDAICRSNSPRNLKDAAFAWKTSVPSAGRF